MIAAYIHRNVNVRQAIVFTGQVDKLYVQYSLIFYCSLSGTELMLSFSFGLVQRRLLLPGTEKGSFARFLLLFDPLRLHHFQVAIASVRIEKILVLLFQLYNSTLI